MIISPLLAEERKLKAQTTQEQYIEQYKHIAVSNMKQYGIPASITLAQGILESASGNSDLARKANNHFGIKCHAGWTGKTFHKDDDAKNECFRGYRKAEESFTDHAIFLSTRSRYASLFELDITDYKGWAHGLKAAGYATNPAYAQRLITLIERHELYRYDSPEVTDTPPELAKKGKRKDLQNTQNQSENNGQSARTAISSGGDVVRKHNGVKYIVAREGEKLQQLADRLDIRPWMLRKYNDFDMEQEINPGDIIYIQAKKRKGEVEIHTVKSGETLHQISQQHAVKLSRLMRLNDLQPDDPLDVGRTIRLR